MQTIPRGPSDVTSAWLGSVLGTDVRDVDITPIGTGQTGATYRASATYATDTDLPGTFAIKLPAQDDTVRERVALGYLSEVEFYTDVAEKVRIPVPGCFFSDISDTGVDFVLVLADMAPAVQGDQIAGCTAQEAGLAVEALAGLHGPSWCDSTWLGLSAISMPKPGDEAAAKGLGDVSVMAADITIDKLGTRMSAEDRETLSAAMALVTPWLMAEPKRYALMHGAIIGWTTCCSIPTAHGSRWSIGRRWGSACRQGIWRTSLPPVWHPRCEPRSNKSWSVGITRPC